MATARELITGRSLLWLDTDTAVISTGVEDSLFGLSVEGIYRLSGSVAHVTKLKGMFDTGEIMLYPQVSQPLTLQKTRDRPILTLGIPRTSSTTSIVLPAC